MVGFAILWFILPETKGIPLEEMGKLFGDEDENNIYLQENPPGDGTYANGEKKDMVEKESPEILRSSNDLEKGDRPLHLEK